MAPERFGSKDEWAQLTDALLRAWFTMTPESPKKTMKLMLDGEPYVSPWGTILTYEYHGGELRAVDSTGRVHSYSAVKKMIEPLWGRGLVSLVPLLDGERTVPLPEWPLSAEEVEGLDEAECLRRIRERHDLRSESLFNSQERERPIWDSYNLAKLALMRLEGFSWRQCSDFFSHEISLLLRDPHVSYAKNYFSVIASRDFTTALRARIKRNKEEPGWVFAASLRDFTLCHRLSETTQLTRNELFARVTPGKGIRYKMVVTQVTADQIATTFLGRLKRVPYRDMLSRLGLTLDSKKM